MGYDLSNFATNETAEEEGIWEDLGGDAKIKVARAGNEKYIGAYARIPRGIRRGFEEATLSSEASLDIFCKLLGEFILVGWENLTDGGKILEYSSENATSMLKKYKDFREFVWEVANDRTRFKDSDLEKTAKKSKAS